MCLGLINKIDLARKWITTLPTDIFFASEAEITNSTDLSIMEIENFTFSHTNLSPKSRMAAYVRTSLNAKIKICPNTETIAISTSKYVIIGTYRPFTHTLCQKEYLDALISFIKSQNVPSKELIIIGDLNFNLLKKPYNSLLRKWISFTDESGLIQTIKGSTWSRTINEEIKSSLLDLIYVQNITEKSFEKIDLNIGDHVSIGCKTNEDPIHEPELKRTIRCWRDYNPSNLITELSTKIDEIVALNIKDQDSHNNLLTNIVLCCLDKIAPERELLNSRPNNWSKKCIRLIRKKRNLISKNRKNRKKETSDQIRKLSLNINREMIEEKRNKIENMIKKNDNSSIWNAVKIARKLP